MTRGILVMGSQVTDNILAVPNMLTPSNGLTTTVFEVSSPTPLTLNASIYTVAGELVKTVSGEAGAGTVSWDAGKVASGLTLHWWMPSTPTAAW